MLKKIKLTHAVGLVLNLSSKFRNTIQFSNVNVKVNSYRLRKLKRNPNWIAYAS